MAVEPKRILYISPNGFLGGAEKATETLIIHHNRRNFEPHVLFLRQGDLVKRIAGRGVKVTVAPRIRLRQIFSHGRLIEFIRDYIVKENISLVHSVMSYGHYFGGLAAFKAKIPEVWYQHGPVAQIDRLLSLVPTKTVLTNSKFTASHQRKIQLIDYPVEVVPPGVDSSQNRNVDRSASRTRFGFTKSDFVYVSIGRLTPGKGQKELVEAFSNVAGQVSDARLLIVGGSNLGSSKYETDVHGLIAKKNLTGKIVMAGFIDDMTDVYAAADVLVHTSLEHEALGLVIAEAMSFGVPVIASPVGGVPELIEDGVTGILARPTDTRALTEAMLKMLTDESLRLNSSTAGLKKIKNGYDATGFVKAVEALYEKLIGDKANLSQR
jgi:glycosyltransferase involved in cell wall biosynthesis